MTEIITSILREQANSIRLEFIQRILHLVQTTLEILSKIRQVGVEAESTRMIGSQLRAIFVAGPG